MITSSIRRRLTAGCACCSAQFPATGVNRRQVLVGSAATIAAGAGGVYAPQVLAQAKPHRIDVHHHVVPPTWLAAMDIIGRTNPPLAHWSI